MEFPHGHHSRSHTHRGPRNDDEENPERSHYPPPQYHPDVGVAQSPPPPSQVSHVEHQGYGSVNYYPPPPPSEPYYQYTQFPPPPPPSRVSHVEHQEFGPLHYPQQPPPAQMSPVHHTAGQVQGSYNYPAEATRATHVSHEVTPERVDQSESNHTFAPHFPSVVHHHSHSSSGSELSKKPAFRIYCKAEPNFSLTIRDGKVILAPSDPSDDLQHWYKDEKYSTRVKDEEGFPCFALVNRATGQAMKHSTAEAEPVQLVPYNPDVLDTSVLWTTSKDFGNGYRTMRMVNNIHLNVDAFHGDKNSGGVRDGTIIVLWQWNKGDNQLWMMTPH